MIDILKNRKKRFITFNSSLMVIVMILTILVNYIALYWDGALSQYFGVVGSGIKGAFGDANQYYKSEYKNEEEVLKAQQELAKEIVGEGAVLLKNDGALPIKEKAKISLFGISSSGGSTSGSGSGEVKGEKATLEDVLKSKGFEVNPTLSDFYGKSSHKHGTGAGPGGGSAMGDWKVDEVPQSEYTSEVKNSYADYNDAAIVVFSRKGGEGGDLPMEMSRFGGEADQSYLELSKEEKDLLRGIKASGTFEKVLVIINSAGSMELGFVDQEEFGVDGCLWYAGTGATGIEAIGDILLGEVSPSGRLVDTYVYDNFSSPAMQNFGDFRYVDNSGNLTNYSYVNYSEGIYVGYKYYETRYEDSVIGSSNVGKYDYSSTVKYPFGYGLSFTNFEWSNYVLTEENGVYTAEVTVKNIGEKPGKDVVQLYVQAPYISGGIEKASVNLAGFAKTKNIEPGETDTVKISFSKEDIASYDEVKEKTYILDKGKYYVTVANNSHSAVNNMLAAKGFNKSNGMDEEGNSALVQSFEVDTLIKCDTSASGEKITNQFEDAKAEDAKYLSRSNWSVMDNGGIRYATGSKSGVSEVTDANGTVGTVSADEKLLNDLKNNGLDKPTTPDMSSKEYPDKSTYIYGAEGDISLIEMLGKDYDDPAWDELLNKMKLSEMHALFNKSGYGTDAIESINKPKTYEYDGPAGISNFITGKGAFGYPASITLSATWNVDLAAQMGSLVGEDALATKTSGWYAPAVNIHRTPFSGRNFEYYSEDPILAGSISANIIEKVQAKGVYVYLKHFALNDQETNRSANGSVATWSNEQAIREIYLKPFQISVEKGGARGLMTALNRIGTTQAQSSYNLLTNVARGEWGFKGAIITDYMGGMNPAAVDQFLAAGGDLILATAACPLTDAKQDWTRAELRRATHNVLYNVANSLAMNGFDSSSVYSAGFPVYKIMLIVLDAIIAIGVGLAGYFTFRTLKMSDEEFIERRKLTKKRRTIIWSIVGVIFVILTAVFFIYALPLIKGALLM